MSAHHKNWSSSPQSYFTVILPISLRYDQGEVEQGDDSSRCSQLIPWRAMGVSVEKYGCFGNGSDESSPLLW